MRRLSIGLALVLFALPADAATQEELREKCQDENPDVSIKACTADIKSGHETADILPLAYYNRGFSYSKKKLYDRAAADYTKAINLKPGFMDAFFNRGYVYEQQGKRDWAVVNYRAALNTDPGNMSMRSAMKRLGVAVSGLGHCVDDVQNAAIGITGTVTRITPMAIVDDVYIDDPSVDCRPIEVNAYKGNTCHVGDSVSFTGRLTQNSDDKGWMFMPNEWGAGCLSGK